MSTDLTNHIFNSKILIYDDQKIHILLLEKILTESGYRNLRSTTEVSELMALCTDLHPDLLILDLPDQPSESDSILERLKSFKLEDILPVLVLSTQNQPDSHLKALQAGATDFVNKPYENIEILVRVRNMVEARFLHNQIRDQNRILEQRVHERTEELKETRLDIIHRLARTAEFRDNETGAHIVRMSRYCALLGTAIGLNETQCELLLHASPLHDIGKIAVPDSILLKPGQLTQHEWEVMKTHTTLGAELLSGSSSALMKMAETIALTHHERFDGSGYPRNLKGEDIPLVGRIAGICDVFDALTSNRPYKMAWSTEEAIGEIKKESGRHFDPRLVEGFLRILPEINNIRETMAE